MKFKQLLKNNIKRISAVILCMILFFTFTATVFAYDGEAPSKVLTANDLKEYTEKTYVYFDVVHSKYGKAPVYSPLNLKTLDAVMSLSVIGAGDINNISAFESSTYFSVATNSLGSGNYFDVYYIIPSTPEDPSAFWEVLKNFFGVSDYYGWSSYFYDVLEYIYSVAPPKLNSDGYIDTFYFNRADDIWANLIPGDDAKVRTSTLVYKVRFKKDGTINTISYGGCYETPTKAFASLGKLYNVSQISFYSDADKLFSPPTSSNTPLFEPTLCENVVNLNQYISSSTYSLTAAEYFCYSEDVAGTSATLNSTGSTLSSITSNDIGTYLCLPNELLKEEYRSSTSSFAKINYNKVYDTSMYQEDISFIALPVRVSQIPSNRSGYVVLVFNAKNPILYMKLLDKKTDSISYFQLVSKVNYTMYYCDNSNVNLIGSFDAENTIFDVIKNASYSTSYPLIVDFYNDCAVVPNNSYIMKYPSLHASLFLDAFGKNCVASIFPQTNTVGFYYYISSENVSNIIENSSSYNPNGNIGSGERPEGSLDFENFWDITVDYENLYPDGFDLNLPDYPSINLQIGGMDDVFDIPDLAVDYLVEVLDWFSESATIFVDSVGGPVRKTYYIAFMVLDAVPDIFSFMIVFSVAILLFLKVLQATSATSYMVSTSVGSDKPKQGRKTERKSKKQDNGRSDGE